MSTKQFLLIELSFAVSAVGFGMWQWTFSGGIFVLDLLNSALVLGLVLRRPAK